MDVQKEQEQQNRTDHVVSGFAFYSEKEKKSGTREWKREGKERECMGKKSVSRQVERGGKIRRQGGGQGENNEDRQVKKNERTRRG